MSNQNPRRRSRNSSFTPEQDVLITSAVKLDGFNNLQNTFESLSMLRGFAGKTPLQIQSRYYSFLRRNVPMFQMISTVSGIVAGVNYKNDPALWTGATARNRGDA